MYYEEKVINGILCWRKDPEGEFTAFTAAQLSEMIESHKAGSETLREELSRVRKEKDRWHKKFEEAYIQGKSARNQEIADILGI